MFSFLSSSDRYRSWVRMERKYISQIIKEYFQNYILEVSFGNLSFFILFWIIVGQLIQYCEFCYISILFHFAKYTLKIVCKKLKIAFIKFHFNFCSLRTRVSKIVEIFSELSLNWLLSWQKWIYTSNTLAPPTPKAFRLVTQLVNQTQLIDRHAS